MEFLHYSCCCCGSVGLEPGGRLAGYTTFDVFDRTAHRVADNPLRVTVSPNILAPEKVMAVEDAPVDTKNIPVAVVSMRIVEAEDREKSSFPAPEEGAEIVKLLSVAVPDEKIESP